MYVVPNKERFALTSRTNCSKATETIHNECRQTCVLHLANPEEGKRQVLRVTPPCGSLASHVGEQHGSKAPPPQALLFTITDATPTYGTLPLVPYRLSCCWKQGGTKPFPLLSSGLVSSFPIYQCHKTSFRSVRSRWTFLKFSHVCTYLSQVKSHPFRVP